MAEHPRRGKGNDPWSAEHDAILVEGIIAIVKSNQRSLYLLPGIVGSVDGHGNDRVSKRITQFLVAFAKANNVAPDVVKTPAKRKAASVTSKASKRVKEEAKQES